MSLSRVVEENPDNGTTCDPISRGIVTIRSKMIEPLKARAMRAATGIARSALIDPSRGTKMRLNIV
jgi:hypothetical protein